MSHVFKCSFDEKQKICIEIHDLICIGIANRPITDLGLLIPLYFFSSSFTRLCSFSYITYDFQNFSILFINVLSRTSKMFLTLVCSTWGKCIMWFVSSSFVNVSQFSCTANDFIQPLQVFVCYTLLLCVIW